MEQHIRLTDYRDVLAVALGYGQGEAEGYALPEVLEKVRAKIAADTGTIVEFQEVDHRNGYSSGYFVIDGTVLESRQVLSITWDHVDDNNKQHDSTKVFLGAGVAGGKYTLQGSTLGYEPEAIPAALNPGKQSSTHRFPLPNPDDLSGDQYQGAVRKRLMDIATVLLKQGLLHSMPDFTVRRPS